MILVVFLLALIIRFLFFPNNIYFGFDQARDAFETLEIIRGNLKLIGPSTSFEGLFHGVAYYYLIVPSYLLSASPEVTVAFLRILNALGVFVIYILGSVLFNKKVGLIASILFTFSFEQSQFAIYMGNPSPAAVSVPLMFLGLALVIFKNKAWGLPLAFFCLGLSIQFQFALFYLVVPFFLVLLTFKKDFLKLPIKFHLASLLMLFLSISTFLLAELKYGFKTTSGLLSLASAGNEKDILTIISTYLFTVDKMLSFNIFGELKIGLIVGTISFTLLVWHFKSGSFRKQVTFLSIWFFSLIVTVLVSGGVKDLQNNIPLYYPNVGVSVSLLLFVAFLVSQYKRIGIIILLVIFVVNINMIFKFNPKGTISEIDVQQGMLLGDEKKVLDYLYQDAAGNPFAVKAITMPFTINTTWSYLFEWYGKDKYGYLPIWNGKNAAGFPGNIIVQEVQERLPNYRYLIIEPTRGVAPHLINEYIQEENYFTRIVEERNIGEFVIQKREKY